MNQLLATFALVTLLCGCGSPNSSNGTSQTQSQGATDTVTLTDSPAPEDTSDSGDAGKWTALLDQPCTNNGGAVSYAMAPDQYDVAVCKDGTVEKYGENQ